MGSEGSRLAESERGVWFWLKVYSICAPHCNRKNELILFRGRKTILTQNPGAQVLTLVELKNGASGVKYLRVLFHALVVLAVLLAIDVLLWETGT